MPPHGKMPHGIPPRIRAGNRLEVGLLRTGQDKSVGRKSADDPYGTGFNGDISKHVVSGHKAKQSSGTKDEPSRGSKRFHEYIGPVDVVPGEPLLVIAQTRGFTINEEFVRQPAQIPVGSLVYAAKAKIGLLEGFFAVSTGSKSLEMRVGDVGGCLQKESVQTPSYNPDELVLSHNNNLIIISTTQISS